MKRVNLCVLPTPCHKLERVSEDLGIEVWIKRDDLTGFALGGNKGRKLEYLMADALKMGAEVVVTCGSAQSNFIRQLGAACSVLGIKTVAAVMELPYAADYGKPNVKEGSINGGNLTLDQMLGVELHYFPNDDWEVLYEHAEKLALQYEFEGKTVYRIPIGGSSPMGAYSFVQAAQELPKTFRTIVTPSSSGSTHAGLTYAFHGTETRVIGIASDPEVEIIEDVMKLIVGLQELIQPKQILMKDIDLRIDWSYPAYGVPSEKGDEAVLYMARREGIMLDPIYTGKAFAGLLDLAKNGELNGPVLFWHTGGVPALFAYQPTISWG